VILLLWCLVCPADHVDGDNIVNQVPMLGSGCIPEFLWAGLCWEKVLVIAI